MESASLSFSDLTEALPVSPTLSRIPIELLRHIGRYLATADLQPIPYCYPVPPAFSDDLISLSSCSRPFYEAFQPERYRLVVLEGEQDSLDFIAWLLSAPQALKSVRCLIIDRVCELHDYEAYASLIARLENLKSFSYRGAHRLHPCIIRSLSTLQREGKLEAVHLEGSVMESAAALAGTDSGAKIAGLKAITLSKTETVAFEDVEDGVEEAPDWMLEHPSWTWTVVEQRLLRHLAAFLSRSASTLEYLDIINLVAFHNDEQYESEEDRSLRQVLHDAPSLATRSPGSDLPILAFPRLTTLCLPSVDLTSPDVLQLLRTSPVLQHLELSHELLSGEPSSSPISLPPLPFLQSLRFSCLRLVEDDDSPCQQIIECLRASPLQIFEIEGSSGTIAFLDKTRLERLVRTFPLLHTLEIHADEWRCSIEDVRLVLLSLKHLTSLAFNFPPGRTDPPSPVPPASDQIAEGSHGPTEVLEEITDYFFLPFDDPSTNGLSHADLAKLPDLTHTLTFRHFSSEAKRLATSLPLLERLDWEMDPLYQVGWELSRAADGEVVAVGRLLMDELDEMVEREEDEKEVDDWRDEIDDDDEEDWLGVD